jgi:two-component system CheB/CheR fusion protein
VTLHTATLPLGAPLRVLIADDQRDLLMTASILLRSEGMAVETVECGADVVPAVEAFKPDVVLLDIEMPDRSGLLVAVELTQRYGERCPVLIALTGHKTSAARRLTAKAGFAHHVTKPYDFDALVSLVASAARKNAPQAS